MDGFYAAEDKVKNRKDGRHPYCKLCRSGEAKNPKTREYKHQWYADHRELTIERQRERYQENTEEIHEYKKQHYQANAKHYKVNALKRYHLCKHDPDFMAMRMWRNLLRNSLIRLKQKKKSSTLTILGYSAEQLKTHLEKLWTPGMSWENYGAWHIDHIVPVCKFNKTTDVKIVNALSNLRPLWATNRTIDGVPYEGNLNRSKH